MASNKLDTMYHSLQFKLKTIKSTLDLLPFINSLMTLKTLKIQLSLTLHQVYNESKSSQKPTKPSNRRKFKVKSNPNYMTIQSLFIQMQRFKNGLSSLKSSRMKLKSSRMKLKSSRMIISKRSVASIPITPINDTNHCSSPTSCTALHRIINALLSYDKLLKQQHNEDIDKMNTYFISAEYKYLLNDYHHILMEHLNQSDIAQTNHTFELIYGQMMKRMQPCDVTKCMKFRRNRRIRDHESNKILKCATDPMCNFYVDALDTIHCYFFHSLDIGMRINPHLLSESDHDERKQNKQHKNRSIERKQKKKRMKVDDSDFYTDKKMQKLKEILSQKLRTLKKHYVIQGGHNKYFTNLNDEAENILPQTLAPVQKNIFNHDKQRKFETIVSELMPHLQTRIQDVTQWLIQYISHEEFTSQEAVRLDLDDETYSDLRSSMHSHFSVWSEEVTTLIHHILRWDIFNDPLNERNMNVNKREDDDTKSTFSTSTSYDFGHKFYYWEEFKHNNQMDYGPNIGYRKRDWYITRKYGSLKEEIISNQIYALDIKQYNEIMTKAAMNIKSEICKRNKSADSVGSEYFQIKSNSPLKMENLVSLILYTDFVDLYHFFRRTFRPISDQETNEQLKNRHREYWNWSKILSETVELYGDSVSNCNIKVFYYGVSFLLSFPNFISHFCGVTSTTKCLEVCTIFSDDNGIILELVAENEYSNLKCFPLSWLSCYSHEEEILFFSGYRPLKFKSIRLMKPSQDYTLFVKALSLFNNVVKAQRLESDVIDAIHKIDYKIIKCLMRHYMTTVQYTNRSPNYINNLFKSFCDSKKYIHINIAYMNQHYPGFKKYLMCSENEDNMLSLEIIGALFPFCEEVVVWETGNITKQYIKKWMKQLKILNIQQHSMLKTIKLCDVRYNNALLNKAFSNQFGSRFRNDVFCRIHLDVKVRLQHENKHNQFFKEIPEVTHLIIVRQYKKYKASLRRNNDNNNNVFVPHHNRRSHKLKRIRKHKQRSRSYHRNSSLGSFRKLTAV